MKKLLLFFISAVMLLSMDLSAYKKGPRGKCVQGDCKNGTGTKVWPDGKKYMGEWKNGKRNGTGTMVYTDGRVEKGRWINGKYQGE